MPIDKKELLAALKDSAILQWLRAQVIQNASGMTLGRFPGQGSAENDNWVYRDACDATHPFNADYVIPKNFQRVISAKLTLILRPYRTYSTLTLSATGTESATHTHNTGAESGHTHSHNHGLSPEANFTGTGTVTWDNATPRLAVNLAVPGTDASSIGSNAAGSSGHTHGTGTESATHTHTVSGTTTLGISEDVAPTNPGITVTFDGVDRTAALGGPFNANMIELDVTQFLPTAVGVQHTVALQPNQRATITFMLRVSYAVDARLAQ